MLVRPQHCDARIRKPLKGRLVRMAVVVSGTYADNGPSGLGVGEEEAGGGVGGTVVAGADDVAVEIQAAAAHVLLALRLGISGQEKAVVSVYNADRNGIVVGVRLRFDWADHSEISISQLIITSSCRVVDRFSGICYRTLE